jgi:hypothetical protein
MIFGDSSPAGLRSGRGRSGSSHYTAYNRYSAPPPRGVRDDGRREMSRRGRATHSFDEIILKSRAEATEVLDRLDDIVNKYEVTSVSDLYEMVGIEGSHVDEKWGWDDLGHASITRVRDGYLLNLPKPEPID